MTQEEAWYFRHNGFHRVARPLPRKLVARLNAVTDEQIATLAEPVVWETGATSRTPQDVRRLSKVLARDPVYLEAATHPIVLNALAGVLGDNIELLTNKHNHIMVRPPNSAPVPWHSGEELYEPTLITALIYLEESTIDNGCVHLVPGSHLRPFTKPRRPRGNFRRNPLYRALATRAHASGWCAAVQRLLLPRCRRQPQQWLAAQHDPWLSRARLARRVEGRS